MNVAGFEEALDAALRIEAAVPGSLYVSVLTLAEIRRGIELLPPGKRRDQLEQWSEMICWNRFGPVEMIRSTPLRKRPEFAAEICRRRRDHGTASAVPF